MADDGMTERQTWEDTWSHIAKTIGQRSRCDRRQIGAVIATADNRIVAVGYNGPPAGYPTSDQQCSSWCPRATPGADITATYGDCISIHAEANAMLFADRRDYKGGTIYVTSVPCWDCAKMIANSGLSAVVTGYDSVADVHRNPLKTFQMLEKCNINVRIVS